MSDTYRWRTDPSVDLRDGLRHVDVIEALHGPDALRMDNRVPPGDPTVLAVCAPTDGQRLIVVVCIRSKGDDEWTIVGARDAGMGERQMWRKYTS